eukprot:CAMPEP_0179951112 /NCGR_PEP_ID=MMETSP0983-20121128/23408_1 /TAXON_ID=483367 /ORGANISM="non described non described, Strain CCMP 2436" /LENGTH=110 /DNA_ID=CAMNT_0021861323 /DNA_START=250 /DNA_END=578 /DNA_ORIENTATION=+
MSQMRSSASSRSSGCTILLSPRLSIRLLTVAGDGGGSMRCERPGDIDTSQSARQIAPQLRGVDGGRVNEHVRIGAEEQPVEPGEQLVAMQAVRAAHRLGNERLVRHADDG